MRQILSLNKLAIELGIPKQVLIDVSSNKTNYYNPFVKSERKKDGTIKERRIENPNKSIRQIQRKINKKILHEECVNLPPYMTGCIEGRSIKDNAKPHVGQPAILCVDISNCFPSISSSKIYDYFRNNLQCSPRVAKILTKLTSYGDRLPQGAPTSPSLCNVILEPMVVELWEFSNKNNLRFSQYVDDLTFSGSPQLLRSNQSEIISIVESYGYEVNIRKLKIRKHSERMEVTGLVVNRTVSVGRRYIRRVQRDIMKGLEPSKIKGKISHVSSVSKNKAGKLTRKLQSKNLTNK